VNHQFFPKLLACGGLLMCTSGATAQNSAPLAAALTVVANDDGFLVEDSGQPVLQYQLKVKSADGKWPRNNYVHPLYDMQGRIITEDFPIDHGHHRGVFWSWHQVLAGDVRMGDAWICKDFVWDIQSSTSTTNKDGSITLSALVHWMSPALKDDSGHMLAAVQEESRITVHPATGNHRLIDFDIGLKALHPNMKIGGSEDDKGYGGFSPRIKMSDDLTFTSSTGVVQPIKTAIECGSWMNIANADFGMAVLCHVDNPGFPEPWILRNERSMQNAVFPGATAVALSTDTPLRLRYRLVIHTGTDSGLDFPELQEQFGR